MSIRAKEDPSQLSYLNTWIMSKTKAMRRVQRAWVVAAYSKLVAQIRESNSPARTAAAREALPAPLPEPSAEKPSAPKPPNGKAYPTRTWESEEGELSLLGEDRGFLLSRAPRCPFCATRPTLWVEHEPGTGQQLGPLKKRFIVCCSYDKCALAKVDNWSGSSVEATRVWKVMSALTEHP